MAKHKYSTFCGKRVSTPKAPNVVATRGGDYVTFVVSAKAASKLVGPRWKTINKNKHWVARVCAGTYVGRDGSRGYAIVRNLAKRR